MSIQKHIYSTFIKKNKSNIVFILLLFSISILYGYPKIIGSRPYSMHQWRQADCLSITLNYYKENRNFFEPAIHWVGDGKDGKTVSECPLIYFTVAQLWKLFGYHEYIFRLVNILIVFTGLFCLFGLIFSIISEPFWAIIITILLFTSPILVYYTNNFTADAPALGLALIGCYFFWSAFKKQRKMLYYLAFVFFLLAGLIKISALISFIAILFIHAYLVISNKEERRWFYKWQSLIAYLVVFIITAAWYQYAWYYNTKNLDGIFLTGLYPIWDLDAESIKNNWHSLRYELLPAYFNKVAFYINVILFIVLLYFKKRANKALFWMNVLVFTGMVAFGILFYKAFTVHDYYLTNLLVFMPLPAIALLEMLKRNYVHLFQNKILKIIVLFAALILIYETTVINRMKYSVSDGLVKNNIAVGKLDMNYWSWFHWDYSNHFKAYESITPYLRNIGLKRTDRVLCLPDISINVSLYLMDQKGFTSYGYSDLSLYQKMELFKRNGVKYLISDSSYFNQTDSLKLYIADNIGNYKNINIYRLK